MVPHQNGTHDDEDDEDNEDNDNDQQFHSFIFLRNFLRNCRKKKVQNQNSLMPFTSKSLRILTLWKL